MKVRSNMALFLAACIWGVAFVSQSAGMDYMGPLTFSAARALLSTAVLIPVILVRRASKGGIAAGNMTGSWKTTLAGGICCGLVITAGNLLQQFGMRDTVVGKAGFITALYIIFVPVLGIFVHKEMAAKVWISVAMGVVGLYLLCVKETFTLNLGDGLLFGCAIVFAVHILVIDYFSPKVDCVILSCLQFLVFGVISAIAAVLFEEPSMAQLKAGMVPVLYAGIMSGGVGYTLQMVGQKNTDPSIAALILSLESVVSVLAGWLLLQETLSPKELLGCVIVFVAIILVQLPQKE